MEIEKIKNMGDAELAAQERETAEQLFRLRFQLKMGQTESITKIRTLRKDIARIKMVVRQREIEGQNGAGEAPPKTTARVVAKSTSRPVKKAAKEKQ